MYFIETSAKECDNVDKLFHEIARDLIQVLFAFFYLLYFGLWCLLHFFTLLIFYAQTAFFLTLPLLLRLRL